MKCSIKYAPQSLNEVIFWNPATQLRIEAYAQRRLENHIILHGPNGTGKSTIARLLPDAIVGGRAVVEDDDFDELLNRKDLKQYLKNSCAMNRFSTQDKVFLVFEEFDNVKVKPNKLWTAMDACADELQVIISTNHVMNIHKSIRDRCDMIHVGKLSAQVLLPRAQFILNSEELNLEDDYVLAYLQQADWSGSLRLYMQKLDELIALQAMGLPLPKVSTVAVVKPSLTVIGRTSK